MNQGVRGRNHGGGRLMMMMMCIEVYIVRGEGGSVCVGEGQS